MVAPLTQPLVGKPRMRGVLHQWAFVVSLGLGLALVLVASPGRERVAALIYALSVAGLLGTSATYHRVNWKRVEVRRWMRKLDHSMIFVLIAGTLTPFGLLVADGVLATAVLIAVWTGAVAGIVLQLSWIDAPAWVSALVYVALGWVGVVLTPDILAELGIVATCMVAGGGVLYTAGAIVYARRRPDPVPTVFGYHEVFHLLVVVAAGLQYAVVAFFVL